VGFNEAALTPSACSAESTIAVCSDEPCVVTGIGGGVLGSWAIAADEDSVFFEGTTTTLAKVPVSGGTSADVRTDLERIWMAAVDAEYVYTTEFEAGVRRVKKMGGDTELVVRPGRGHATALAVDSAFVYVTLTDENQVAMVPKSGGQPTLLAGQSTPSAIAVDSKYAYWVNQGAEDGVDGQLMRAPSGDLTGAETLLSDLRAPTAIAVGDDDVFFAGPSGIFRVPKAGGDAELVTNDFGPVKSMTAYGDTAYAAGMAGLGRVRADGALQVVDSRPVLGVTASCRGVFGTGWFESFLIRYGR
jgi:hypothetical protein